MNSSLKRISMAFFGLFLLFPLNAQIDSLEQSFQNQLSNQSYLDAYQTANALLSQLFDAGDSEKSIDYSQQLLDLTKTEFSGNEKDSLLSIAYDRAMIAHSYNFQNLETALAYADSSIQLQERFTFTGRLPNTLSNMASFLNRLNRPVEAIKVLEKAQNLILSHADDRKEVVLSGVYFQIALSHRTIGQLEQALDYSKKTFRAIESLDDSNDKYTKLGVRHQLMAAIYYDMDSLELSKEQAQKALFYAEELNNLYEMINALNLLGNNEKSLKNFELSEEYYTRVVQISKKLNNEFGYIMALINRGGMYSDKGDYKKGLNDLFEALPYCEKMGNLEFLRVVNYNISEVYEKLNIHEPALKYFKEYKQIEDSLKNQTAQSKLNELNVKYETLEKENQLAEQDLILQTQEATIANQKTRITAIGGGALISLLIGVMYYNRSKAKQKALFQAQILSEKERGLEAILEAAESERKRISKDLHDGIGQQLSALKMGLESLESKTSGPVERHIKELTERFSKSADEVRQISHQMMPRALMENGLIEAMEELLSNSFRYTNLKYTFEHQGIDARFDEKVEVSLYRILQELVNNVIKHSEATLLSVQLMKSKNQLVLFVEDNGKGLTGTNAKGHGLLNIQSRLDLIKGKVNFEPSPDSGLLATVVVPL